MKVKIISAIVAVSITSMSFAAQPYKEGSTYKSGDIVEAANGSYKCKPMVASWCSGAAWAYAPATGTAWDSAWEKVGDTPTPTPTPTPSNQWEAGNVYNTGDVVTYNGVTYKAGYWTKGDNPEQNNDGGKGWGAPWQVIGHVPTPTPTPPTPTPPGDLPCGFKQVLDFAVSNNEEYKSAEYMFNNVLFSKEVRVYNTQSYQIDGICKVGEKYNTNKAIDCTKPYYTYDGLITATKKYPEFACTGTLADRVRDVSGYLANISQETTAAASYTNDGLYYRGENAVGDKAYDPKDMYITTNNNDLTSYCHQGSGQAYSSAVYKFNPDTLSFTADKWVNNCPAEYSVPMTSILGSGNWYGHGPMQLTGDSIFLATAVYNQRTGSNLSVKQYADALLNDDGIAWDSSLMYWNISKPNQPNQQPPSFYMLSGNPDWGFAKSVYMVNGGCNNYAQRLTYFEHFNDTLSKNSPDADDKQSIEQLTCNK